MITRLDPDAVRYERDRPVAVDDQPLTYKKLAHDRDVRPDRLRDPVVLVMHELL
jgi:hypothetical protein